MRAILFTLLSLSTLLLLHAHDRSAGPPTPTVALTKASAAPKERAQAPIGVAMMEGTTIVLELQGSDGGRTVHGRFVYPPSHRHYEAVRNHLGAMKPGEQKPVPPWPAVSNADALASAPSR